jgi:hypothetical protein
MSHLLILLVLLVTTFLSSLFSPARGDDGDEQLPIFSFVGWFGDAAAPVGSARPGGVIEVAFSSVSIGAICIKEESQNCSPPIPPIRSLPKDTELRSTNKAVASVSSGPSGPVIQLNSPGATILQVRRHRDILASFVLIVTPVPPGTLCGRPLEDVKDTVVDCSGKCVGKNAEVLRRLGDDVCDDGRGHDDGREPIDLSCASFIPTFLSAVAPFEASMSLANVGITPEDLARLASLPNDLDGGDCSLKESCMAQFGTAPGFEPCITISTSNFCSFNATTGTRENRGTCAAMCQRFGSRCVAALNNNPDTSPGCTPGPNSRDTCETPRRTEICICERR